MTEWNRPIVGEVWIFFSDEGTDYHYLVCEDHGKHLAPKIDAYTMLEIETGIKDIVYIYNNDHAHWSKYDQA